MAKEKWIRGMADKEDECESVSVGGFFETSRLLEKIDRRDKIITTLLNQLKDKDEQLKRYGGHTTECKVYNDDKPASLDPDVAVEDEFECIKDCGWAALEDK